MGQTKIQIALDLTDIDRAAALAVEVADVADRIEVGTLLLRRYGLGAVEAVRRCAPSAYIVADSKVMDCGREEVQLAADAGADAVTVEAAAPGPTIELACAAAADEGIAVMLDSIGSFDSRRLAAAVGDLKVSHVIFHTARDEQVLRRPWSVREAAVASRIAGFPPLAVAGGLGPDEMPGLLTNLVPDLVIVGQAVVASKNPKSVVRQIRSILDGCGGHAG